MTRERRNAFLQDLEDMEEGMSRTAERSDIWQDRVVYALCRSVWHILTFLMFKFGKEESKMYVVDGYKMTEGTATFQHKNIFTEEMITVSVNSVFLYRPDTKLWYVAPCKEYPWGCAFQKDDLVQIEEAGGKTVHD